MGGSNPRKRTRVSGTQKNLKDVVPKPEGAAGGPKRTPNHWGDAYKGHPSYEVESVLASGLHDSRERYKIKWVGIPSHGNTWEPEAHLIGDDAKRKLADFIQMRDKKEKVNCLVTNVANVSCFISCRPCRVCFPIGELCRTMLDCRAPVLEYTFEFPPSSIYLSRYLFLGFTSEH
jgi:hypothetical protein